MWPNFNSLSRQFQLLVQVLCLCFPTLIVAIIYSLVEIFDVPHPVVIFVNINWQLSHGLHGLVYLRFNTQIRKEIFSLFGKTRFATVSSTHTAIVQTAKTGFSKISA
ncbi:hypothetical protein OESDEN_20794 [Oesophagostomum dentatum]|uniref:7TM GPCR serpentine receptor class x (Srx) domain-containing protein n=1 Tax=Oesophagostomum dentatum TaxID=61180 RepID=A0A0B1S6N8_OESDE|nr:hypothetical protein OESDEN_20794 [Oesophagostomum dentatum]